MGVGEMQMIADIVLQGFLGLVGSVTFYPADFIFRFPFANLQGSVDLPLVTGAFLFCFIYYLFLYLSLSLNLYPVYIIPKLSLSLYISKSSPLIALNANLWMFSSFFLTQIHLKMQ